MIIENENLIDAGATALLCGVQTKTIRKWTSEGRLPVVRLSARCVRYPKAAILKWIEARTINAKGGRKR